MRSSRLLRAVPVLLLALIASLVASLAAVGPATAQTVTKQDVYGRISCPHVGKCPNIKVSWFDGDWHYLGQQKANGGGYALRLAPGTYHLQFTDQRPSYDVSKYAPTDIGVSVGSHDVSKNVTMRPGAAITGTARGGGRPLASATIYAANKAEQSFSTTANKKGQFAVGGLPAGKYCLFTYDRAKNYVGKCTWAGGVNYGQIKNKSVKLTQRAGSLTVLMDTNADKNPPAPPSTVTVTSKATGQWWTSRLRQGKAVFRGLYPGRYNYKYNGTKGWLTATGSVQSGRVRSGSMSFGNARLTKHGAWIDGTVVDTSQPGRVLAGAVVQAWSSTGSKLGETTSDANGIFSLTGQIYTQSGVTLVVQPGPYSDYLGQEPNRCQYVPTTHPGYAVVENKHTYVDDVSIDRKPGQTNPNCTVSATRPQAKDMSASPQ